MSENPDRQLATRPTSPILRPGSPGDGHGGSHPHGEPEEIHLPPNSWVPLSVALSLTMLFVGFLQARPVNYVVCVIGGVWFVGSLLGWYTSARSEYGELH